MTLGTFGEGSPHRQRLAEALRGLRRTAGLSGEQLAEQTGISQSKVSRIELGQSVPSAADVDRWAKQTGASEQQRLTLLELTETAATEAVAWRRRMRRGLVGLQEETAELEATAGTIRVFNPMLVPGLLQTPGYARAVYQAAHPTGQPDLAEAIEARLRRQAILYKEDKRFEFVLTEAGLRTRLGPPELLLEQLGRLTVAATLPNVALGIIPLDREVPVWHTHGFVIFDDRDGEPVVSVETLTSALNVRDPEDVANYQDAFARLRAVAASGAEARTLLERIAADLRPASA